MPSPPRAVTAFPYIALDSEELFLLPCPCNGNNTCLLHVRTMFLVLPLGVTLWSKVYYCLLEKCWAEMTVKFWSAVGPSELCLPHLHS